MSAPVLEILDRVRVPLTIPYLNISISRNLGKGRAKGRKLSSWREKVVKECFELLEKKNNEDYIKPDWLISYRISTPDEDHAGKDFVAQLDIGEVYLQVLSSKSSFIRWRAKYGFDPKIGVLRFGSSRNHKLLTRRLLATLSTIRANVLNDIKLSWLDPEICSSIIDPFIRTMANFDSVTRRVLLQELAKNLCLTCGLPVQDELCECLGKVVL